MILYDYHIYHVSGIQLLTKPCQVSDFYTYTMSHVSCITCHANYIKNPVISYPSSLSNIKYEFPMSYISCVSQIIYKFKYQSFSNHASHDTYLL